MAIAAMEEAEVEDDVESEETSDESAWFRVILWASSMVAELF